MDQPPLWNPPGQLNVSLLCPAILVHPSTAEGRPDHVEGVFNDEKGVGVYPENRLFELFKLDVVGDGHQNVAVLVGKGAPTADKGLFQPENSGGVLGIAIALFRS